MCKSNRSTETIYNCSKLAVCPIHALDHTDHTGLTQLLHNYWPHRSYTSTIQSNTSYHTMLRRAVHPRARAVPGSDTRLCFHHRLITKSQVKHLNICMPDCYPAADVKQSPSQSGLAAFKPYNSYWLLRIWMRQRLYTQVSSHQHSLYRKGISTTLITKRKQDMVMPMWHRNTSCSTCRMQMYTYLYTLL